MLRGVSDQGQARSIADRVEVSLSRPIEVSGRLVAVGASVGTATSVPGETDGEALLARADRAMYEVKQTKPR